MLKDDEIDVDFEIDADIVYQPAFTTGLPENCYPDESECTITEIKVMSDLPFSDSDILAALETQVGEGKIIEDLWEDYMDRGVDDRG